MVIRQTDSVYSTSERWMKLQTEPLGFSETFVFVLDMRSTPLLASGRACGLMGSTHLSLPLQPPCNFGTQVGS